MACMSTQGSSTAVYLSVAYYDVAADVWYQMLVNGQIANGSLQAQPSSIPSSLSFTLTPPSPTPFVTGSVTSVTSRRIVDTSQSMAVNEYTNMQVKMTSGNANGLYKTKIANNATLFTFGNDWSDNARNVAISPGDTYIVQADTDKIWFTFAGTSILYQYSIDAGALVTGQLYDCNGIYPHKQWFGK